MAVASCIVLHATGSVKMKVGVRWFSVRSYSTRFMCMLLLSLFLVWCGIQMSWVRRQRITPLMHLYNHTSRNMAVISLPTLYKFVNPDVRTVLMEPQPCSEVVLMVIVCSSTLNSDARMAIRSTWGEEAIAIPGVRLAFLVGHANSSNWQMKLDEESRNYSDIIQEDFIDSYDNLTLKTIMMLKWVNNSCPNAHYLMKSDDDMFVNVPNLLAHLKSRGSQPRLLLGSLFSGAIPERSHDTKYYSSESYGEAIYPDYLSGTAYVISGDIIASLYTVALSTPFFRLEDVFLTGLCAKRLGLDHTDDRCFHYNFIELDSCRYKHIISSHRISPQQLRTLWASMHDPHLQCENALYHFILQSIRKWYC